MKAAAGGINQREKLEEKTAGTEKHSVHKMDRIHQALVAHTYNPSYSRGRDQEDHGSKPAPGK
jgi:hypothetical protein